MVSDRRKVNMRHAEYYIQTMIATIREYGLRNHRVLDAMMKTPRHLFIPEDVPLDTAYGDHPVPIGEAQTISQPFTVAFMLDLLDPRTGNNVLEVGAGSGWNAALIKCLVGSKGRITALEIDQWLFLKTDQLLKRLAIDAEVHCRDGSKGFHENAPYDRIVVTCAAPKIYDAWIRQLKPGGIIVAPVGVYTQDMIRGFKEGSGLEIEHHGAFQFVPMRFSAQE